MSATNKTASGDIHKTATYIGLPTPAASQSLALLLEQYGCGPIPLIGGENGFYERPWWHYYNEAETRRALDSIVSDDFSGHERGVFTPLHGALLDQGDHYMHLADLKAYLDADQKLLSLYADPDAWNRKAILTSPPRGDSPAIERSISTRATSGALVHARSGERWGERWE